MKYLTATIAAVGLASLAAHVAHAERDLQHDINQCLSIELGRLTSAQQYYTPTGKEPRFLEKYKFCTELMQCSTTNFPWQHPEICQWYTPTPPAPIGVKGPLRPCTKNDSPYIIPGTCEVK